MAGMDGEISLAHSIKVSLVPLPYSIDWMVFPPNSYGEALMSNLMAFEDVVLGR